MSQTERQDAPDNQPPEGQQPPESQAAEPRTEEELRAALKAKGLSKEERAEMERKLALELQAPPRRKMGRAIKEVRKPWAIFESREAEPSAFPVLGIRPERSFHDRRLIWRVPPELLELFEQNFFVQTGRVQRAYAREKAEE